MQHRFGGEGELAGHSVGNLLIAALWEETGDVVAGLDLVASLLEAHGRVLPVSASPLDFVAEVQFEGEAQPREVRGQAAVASTPGRVVSVRVEPADPPVCREAIAAVEAADHLVLGPGSWYTSVTAPLLVPELREAVRTAPGARSLVLNLVPQPGETSDFKPHTHLQVWRRDFPDITLQHVFADPARIDDVDRLRCEAEAVGADLVLRPLTAAGEDDGVHDPDLLAAAFAAVFGRGRITPWR